MSAREERVLTWLIPGLMTATLALVGWMALNINRMSENLAVVVYRVETQASNLKELQRKIQFLEMFAMKKRGEIAK